MYAYNFTFIYIHINIYIHIYTYAYLYLYLYTYIVYSACVFAHTYTLICHTSMTGRDLAHCVRGTSFTGSLACASSDGCV